MSQVASPPSTSSSRTGITVIRPEPVQRFERRLTLAVTVIPFIATIFAVVYFWGRGVGALDLAIFFAMYCLTGLGVTVGFHRMLTHGSFNAKPWVRATLAACGSMALQGPVIRWVADHRRHHAFADLPGDPHSPHLEEAEGVKGVLAGLWHSHMGWLFEKETTKVSRFAPDLLKEPAMRKVDRLFPLWVALSLLIPAFLGLAITRSLYGALTALIWGGLVRIFFLHHITWSINSICHFYGSRAFVTQDFSTNNWLLSLVSFGEAWHNNHHAFPTSARHGLGKWQLDPSAALIRGMQKLGLAWDIKLPEDKQLAAKRLTS